MKIEVKLDETSQETTVIVIAPKMSEDVKRIVEKLSDETPQVIAGFKEDILEILQPAEIFRVYAANQKVYAVTPKGEYLLRSRLYEMESRLANHGFIRISNSEIVNISKIVNFDLSYAGTIGISLSFGEGTYISCAPDLIDAVGTETGAVIVQTILDILLGIAFGASSVIWSVDAFSIAKQTLLYLFITLPVMLFVAYFACWMEHSLKGLLSYAAVFIVIFVFIWLVQYVFWKIRIKRLNGRLSKKA